MNVLLKDEKTGKGVPAVFCVCVCVMYVVKYTMHFYPVWFRSQTAPQLKSFSNAGWQTDPFIYNINYINFTGKQFPRIGPGVSHYFKLRKTFLEQDLSGLLLWG